MNVNRRGMLKRAAMGLAACGLAAASKGSGAETRSRQGLTVGISTLGFNKHTNASLAKELSAEGFTTIQLFLKQTDSNFWVYNGRADVSSLTPARCREIAQVYRDAGLTINSIGVYTNLIHPDEAELSANLAYFDAMMEIGGHMGVRTFVNEAGHYHDPKKPAPAVPIEYQDAVWPHMVELGQRLAALADKHDAKVLLEPFYRGFLSSAKRLRLYVEAIGSPRIRVLLDPANLIEVNDLDEMFQQLAPLVDCIHAKDRKLHTDRGVAAGKGDLDYRRLVALSAARTPAAPLVLEYVGQDDYQAARAHLMQAIRDEGLVGKSAT